MTTDTTPAAIEALLKDVTPGPWAAEPGDDRHGGSWGGYWQIDAEHDAVMCNQFCMAGASNPAIGAANARFIAWCREGVPALAAELATARAERDEWKAAATAHHPNPADHRYWEGRYRDEAAELAALRKEVERLRGDAQ